VICPHPRHHLQFGDSTMFYAGFFVSLKRIQFELNQRNFFTYLHPTFYKSATFNTTCLPVPRPSLLFNVQGTIPRRSAIVHLKPMRPLNCFANTGASAIVGIRYDELPAPQPDILWLHRRPSTQHRKHSGPCGILTTV